MARSAEGGGVGYGEWSCSARGRTWGTAGVKTRDTKTNDGRVQMHGWMRGGRGEVETEGDDLTG